MLQGARQVRAAALSFLEIHYLAEVSVRVLGVIEHPIHLLTFYNAKATLTSGPENLRNIKASEPVLAIFTVAPEVNRRRSFKTHR